MGARFHPFLRLPIALRDIIYRLYFSDVPNPKIHVCGLCSGHQPAWLFPNKYTTAILQACHQTHNEARRVLYADIRALTFHFRMSYPPITSTEHWYPPSFYTMLSQYCNNIRQITVHLPAYLPSCYFDIHRHPPAHAFTNLQVEYERLLGFHLSAFEEDLGQGDWFARKFPDLERLELQTYFEKDHDELDLFPPLRHGRRTYGGLLKHMLNIIMQRHQKLQYGSLEERTGTDWESVVVWVDTTNKEAVLGSKV